MIKRQIFHSFHYDKDVMRVQQIRNIGALEGNPSVSHSEWETIKRGGDIAIKSWIDNAMNYRSCVVVLIGEETSQRPWVRHEIIKAWNDGKGLFGIYIHNLNCPRNGKSQKGLNPFENILLKNGSKLSSIVQCYDPSSSEAYNDIARNLETWVERAIQQRK